MNSGALSPSPSSQDSAARILQELDRRERKRQQNRIAQQTYRRNQKQRIKALEAAAATRAFTPEHNVHHVVVTPPPSTPESYTSDVVPCSEIEASALPMPMWDDQAILNWSCVDTTWAEYPPQPVDCVPVSVPVQSSSSSGMASCSSNDEGRTSLHRAVATGSEPLARLLLEHGADITKQDNWGNTALHIAAESGGVELVTLLLGRSADPGQVNYMGRNVLFSAVQGRNEAVVRLLLDSRLVPVNSRDSWGNVPLHVAIEQGSEDMVLLLLSYGANINA